MFEVLESIPAYSRVLNTHITEKAYNEAVTEFKNHLNRAFELYRAWWKSQDSLLFNISLEELLKASKFMEVIVYAVDDDKTSGKLSKRATFMYDLSACLLGHPATPISYNRH